MDVDIVSMSWKFLGKGNQDGNETVFSDLVTKNSKRVAFLPWTKAQSLEVKDYAPVDIDGVITQTHITGYINKRTH